MSDIILYILLVQSALALLADICLFIAKHCGKKKTSLRYKSLGRACWHTGRFLSLLTNKAPVRLIDALYQRRVK